MNDILHMPKLLGKNLRQLRIHNDLTLAQLAERTGLSKSFLSMIESGSRSVKIMTDLRSILVSMNYSLGRFVTEAQEHDEDAPHNEPTAIVQTQKHTLLLDGKRDTGSYRLLLLRPLRSSDDAEFLELYLPPRTQLTEENTTIPAEVRGIVRSGSFLLVLQGDEFMVREGEEFCFDGSTPHIMRNFTDEPVCVNLVVHPGKL